MAEKWMTSGQARLKQRQGLAARAEQRAAVTRATQLYEPPPAPAFAKNHPLKPRKYAEGACC